MNEESISIFDFKLPVKISITNKKVVLDFNGFNFPTFETLLLLLSYLEGESLFMLHDAENKIIKYGGYNVIVILEDLKVKVKLDEKTQPCRYTQALIIRKITEHLQQMEINKTISTSLKC